MILELSNQIWSVVMLLGGIVVCCWLVVILLPYLLWAFAFVVVVPIALVVGGIVGVYENIKARWRQRGN